MKPIYLLVVAFALVSPAFGDDGSVHVGVASWWQGALAYILTPAAVSGAASALAAVLPQGERGTVWGFVRKVVDAAAWNWGNASNEPK